MSLDFELHFATATNGLLLRAKGPTLPAMGKDFPRSAPPLAMDKLERLRQDQAPPALVREVQRQLGTWLLGNDLEPYVMAALRTASQPLRLVLSFDEAVLATLGEIPFELVEYNNAPLALDPRIASLVHLLPKVGATPVAPPQANPLRVLFVRSDPDDLGNIVPPAMPICETLMELAQPRTGQVDKVLKIDLLSRETGSLAPPTWANVRHQLQTTEYHVLVYLGHGDLKTLSDLDAGALLLESSDGATQAPVYAPQLQVALQNYPVPVVLLMGCLTAAQRDPAIQTAIAEETPQWMRGSQGVAQALVNSHSGVQVAVGMRSILSTDGAKTFINAFFKSLLVGRQPGHVEAAIRAARMELYQEYPQSPSWAAPILFHAPLAEPLFTFLPPSLAVPTTTAPPPPASGITVNDLRERLLNYTSTDDLRDLCFVMGIDDEQFDTSTKPRFVRDLLEWLRQHGRLEEFVRVLKAEKAWVLR